jgi:hypothetical protein
LSILANWLLQLVMSCISRWQQQTISGSVDLC